MKSFSWICCIVIFLCSQMNGQIINMESKRLPSDTIGWFGSLGASFAISKDKSEIIHLSHDGHVQFKSYKHLWLYFQDFSFLQADNTDFVDNGFFHIRYNYKWNPLVRIEAFSQFQFNSLVSIDKRLLLGIGPRFKLSQAEKYKVYLGLLYMHEWEQISLEMPPPDREEWDNIDSRLSSYLSFTMRPGSNFSLTSTTYFQPKFEDFGDLRVHSENQLTFNITSKFSFTTSFKLSFDSEPPIDVPKTVYKLSNGLKYDF